MRYQDKLGNIDNIQALLPETIASDDLQSSATDLFLASTLAAFNHDCRLAPSTFTRHFHLHYLTLHEQISLVHQSSPFPSPFCLRTPQSTSINKHHVQKASAALRLRALETYLHHAVPARAEPHSATAASNLRTVQVHRHLTRAFRLHSSGHLPRPFRFHSFLRPIDHNTNTESQSGPRIHREAEAPRAAAAVEHRLAESPVPVAVSDVYAASRAGFPLCCARGVEAFG